MSIDSSSPQIGCLRLEVEKKFGRKVKVHQDFVELADSIQKAIKQHISETTLERVWQYSCRTAYRISLHTLNLLCLYIDRKDWQDFCRMLSELGIIDSEMFDSEFISSSELKGGDRLMIGWLPDRICIIEYKGDNRYEAIECSNSTLRPGDTFSCLEFGQNIPAIMDNFISANAPESTPKRYVAGKTHGLTILKKLPDKS